MRILPVIDILNGTVVRGVAGRRDEYRPISSQHADGSDATSIASGLNRVFGFQRFYMADLDGIMQHAPNRQLYQQFIAAGYELLIDAGVRSPEDADEVLVSDAVTAVAALETLAKPIALREIVLRHGPERIVFSLDLKSGAPLLSHDARWDAVDPWGIVENAVSCGVTRLIVLDLADVGSGTGGSTADLCQAILRRFPNLQVIAGGGVRGKDDVRRWQQIGISELLVASALHDGRLTPEFVSEFA